MIDSRTIWSKRARTYGRRSVYDLSLSEEEFEEVTVFQQRELYPLLVANLSWRPKHILDYGCGAGRFSASLRALTGATSCVGFDPCTELIAMAEAQATDENTRFVSTTSQEFFNELQLQFDLIWIATVLGGIAASELAGL